MNKKTILSIVLCCAILSGCKSNGSEAHATGSVLESASSTLADTAVDSKSSEDTREVRDSTPDVLVPAADGTDTYGTDTVTIDASHTDQGYVMVCYTGNNPKVKLQITTPDDTTYTYLLSQDQKYETFPLPGGDGSYSLTVLENVEGDMYSVAFSQDLQAGIADEFLPFLYPNQYVFLLPDQTPSPSGRNWQKGCIPIWKP